MSLFMVLTFQIGYDRLKIGSMRITVYNFLLMAISIYFTSEYQLLL